ncbi:DUF4912 domain-containing protein [Niallia endozanthoxylica]|uniref:DUF4912 domain-containing protein n=1 Tax=Niallia endozanthoxylica TaxID=2036016 RepID=A0A5J5HXC4_9BACI|nr:DUF4912 domain-containing protein [Niallia endozanthoxylica]KAA9026298.1 DUF4912 domain-containing protein [Niallia endozanthoxylica]
MIKEIMKLRRKGLSFRKIADELDTTVGKVQYQWKKYKKMEEAKIVEQRKKSKVFIKISNKSRYLNIGRLKEDKEHLTSWNLAENKLFVFWKLSGLKKDLVSNYFDQPFKSFQKVLRIYHVTHTPFNGQHLIQEVKLQNGQCVSLLRKLEPNCCYIIELGILISGHKFFPLLRSNPIHFPKGNENQNKLENEEVNTIKNTPPKWIEHVSTYSYYESILKKDDRS